MKKYENRLNSFPLIGNFARKLIATILTGIVLLIGTNGYADWDFDHAILRSEKDNTHETGWVHDGVSNRPIHAGIKIDASSGGDVGRWDSNSIQWVATGNGNIYNLGRVYINLSGLGTSWEDKSYAGIATNDAVGTFNLGNGIFNVSGSVRTGGNHTLYGFIYLDNSTFTGTINGGSRNINVTAATTGEVVGVYFRQLDAHERADIALTDNNFIQFGNITATTNDGNKSTDNPAGAAAFAAGNFTAGTITLGNLTANAANAGWAVGAEFESINGGTLTIASATANAVIEAYGLRVHGDVKDTTIGNVSATASGTTSNVVAVGIDVEGNAILNLGGNITATAQNGNAYGIRTTGNAQLILEDDVVIYGTKAGVKTDGSLEISGSGKYADLGIVNIGTTFYVGKNTTVALDILNSKFFTGTNSNFLSEGAKLEVYGDINNGASAKAVEFIGLKNGNFANIAEFTEWYLDGQTVRYGGNRKYAHMGDGYLAALTMHNRYAAWHSVRDHLMSGSGSTSRSSRNQYRGQSPYGDMDCDPCDPVIDPCAPAVQKNHRGSRRGAWVNYVGRSDAYYSGFHAENWRISANGIQTGADLFRTKYGQFGVLFGYEGGRMRNAADKVNMDDIYVGAYFVQLFRNGADVRGVFAYGFQDYDMRRLAKGGNLYTSSFEGTSMEANLEIGKRLAAGAWSLRPVVAVDTFHNVLDRATERGGVTYNGVDLTQVFLRTGTELRFQKQYFTLNSGIYYAYDVNGDELRTGVQNSLGQRAQLLGSKLGREIMSFNLGGECWLTKKLAVFGGYQGEYAMNRINAQLHSIGYIGAGWEW